MRLCQTLGLGLGFRVPRFPRRPLPSLPLSRVAGATPLEEPWDSVTQDGSSGPPTPAPSLCRSSTCHGGVPAVLAATRGVGGVSSEAGGSPFALEQGERNNSRKVGKRGGREGWWPLT